MWIAGMLLLTTCLAAAVRLDDVRRAGAAFETQARWTEAAAVYESALDHLPPDASPADRFWLLTSLAEVSFERHDYSAAHRWLQQAVPSDDAGQARLLNARGTLELVEGNLTAAARDLGRALDWIAPDNVLDRAAALHNLAAVEMHTGRLPAAESHQRGALNLWRATLGDRHPYVLKAWISLSSLQGLQGNWRGAATTLESALRIRETPEALANYAIVLAKLHRAREAREIRKRVSPAAVPSQSFLDVHSTAAPVRTR